MALAACKPVAQNAQTVSAGCTPPAVTAPVAGADEARANAQPAPAGYDFPALTGRVVDTANLLSVSERRRLSNRLVDVEKQSKHQFVVVTVKSLGGHVIADYGVNLGRTWGIGRKCFNDGVLLIVAPNERKVRIEVGYGLEKALRDEEAAAIIEQDILPHFKAGNFSAGISAGSEAIIREITQ